MVSMGMAQAVYQHAHDFYDTGRWYVVAECWDVLATAAIAHFHQMIHPRTGSPQH